MSSKKKWRTGPPVNALHVFANAWGYAVAARAIYDQGPINFLLMPRIVCSVFSLELFLKCMHRIRRRNVEGHNPQKLFAQLSKKDRRNITDIYDRIIKDHPSYPQFVAGGVTLDVDSVLLRASDLFVRFRYWHENKRPTKDAKGWSGNTGIDRLSFAIRDYIIQFHPEYPEKIRDIKFYLDEIRLPST